MAKITESSDGQYFVIRTSEHLIQVEVCLSKIEYEADHIKALARISQLLTDLMVVSEIHLL